MLKKRALALLLCGALLASQVMVSTVYAAPTRIDEENEESAPPAGIVTGTLDEAEPVDFSVFTDVQDHWAASAMEWAVTNGILNGTSDTTISPDGTVTRAQMAAMVARAFGATRIADLSMYVDLKPTDWYYEEIGKAVQMGCISGFGNSMNPNEEVNRQEVAMTLVKAAGYPVVTSSLTQFADYDSIDTWARNYISTALANGLITGYDNGTFAPKDRVTRAQFVTMLQRVASAYMTPTAVFTEKNVDGSLMVGVGNISLENMTVSQNLFLTDGVGDGAITLSGTTVNGILFVRGTGPNSVKLTNGSRVNTVVLCNPNTAVRLQVDDTSSVNTTYVTVATNSAVLVGDVGDVIISTGEAPVRFESAEAGDVIVQSKLAVVTIDQNSVVDDITLAANSAGAELTLDGRANSLSVSANDTTAMLNGYLNRLSFGSAGVNGNLVVSRECNISNLQLDRDDLELTLAGVFDNVTLSGDDCDITFSSGADIDRMNITGSRNTVTFESGSSTREVYVEADDVVLDGSGEVSRILLEEGDNIDISIPGAEVTNNECTNVIIGDLSVKKDSTVTVSSSGDSTEEYDEEQAKASPYPSPSASPSPSPSASPSPSPSPSPSNSPGVGGGGTGNNNGGNPPAAPSATLRLASDGQPSDFGFNSAYSYSSFGTGLAYDAAVGRLTGTVYMIENFQWYSDYPDISTGYFVPFVIDTREFNTRATVTINGIEFDRSIQSNGSALNGYLIAYVAVGPNSATDGLVTVEFDPDGGGALGSAYAPLAFTIDVSGLTYLGSDAAWTSFNHVAVASGVDGAETATFQVTAQPGLTENTWGIALRTLALLETKNEFGQWGRWTGFKFEVPSGAAALEITSTGVDGTPIDTQTQWGVYDASSNAEIVTYYFDASVRDEFPDGVQLTMKWLNAAGQPAVDYSPGIYVLDLSGCVFAGETGADANKQIVTESIAIVAATDEDMATYGRLDEYALNFRVADMSIGGVLLPAPGGRPTISAGKFYAPIMVTYDAPVVTSIAVDGTRITTTMANNPNAVLVMAPVVGGASADDILITIAPMEDTTTYKETSFVVSCAAVSASSVAVYATDEIPESVNSVSSTSLISDADYQLTGPSLEIKATYLKQTNTQALGFEDATEVWVAPIRLGLIGATLDYQLFVQAISTDLDAPVWYKEFTVSGSTYDLLVPAAIDGYSYSAVYVDLVDSTGMYVSSATIFLSGTTDAGTATITPDMEVALPPDEEELTVGLESQVG